MKPALVCLVIVAACAPARSDTILVSAASSLTDVFAAMETAYEEVTPGADVVINLGGSSALRTQIMEGAPADVFASADGEIMSDVVSAGMVSGGPRVFATNGLAIAVPPGNPAGVKGLADFGNGALYIGLCAPEVPCGRFARMALAAAGVTPSPDTEEPDVRSLLTKIEVGELDAGIVYRTDVVAADGRVDSMVVPGRFDVSAAYPIAALDREGEGFVAFVLSPSGRAILRRFGFGLP